jgi:hypothetical protein
MPASRVLFTNKLAAVPLHSEAFIMAARNASLLQQAISLNSLHDHELAEVPRTSVLRLHDTSDSRSRSCQQRRKHALPFSPHDTLAASSLLNVSLAPLPPNKCAEAQAKR